MSELKPCRVDSVSGWCLEHDAKGRLQEALYCDKGPNPYRRPQPIASVELSEEDKRALAVADGQQGSELVSSWHMKVLAALVRRLLAGCAKCADTGNPGDTKAVWKRKAMEAEARCAAKDAMLLKAKDLMHVARAGVNNGEINEAAKALNEMMMVLGYLSNTTPAAAEREAIIEAAREVSEWWPVYSDCLDHHQDDDDCIKDTGDAWREKISNLAAALAKAAEGK